LSRRGDPALPHRVGESNQGVGVADIERTAHQRHAERLVQSLEEYLAAFGHTVAIRVSQQRDAVRADPHRVGASHCAEHGIIEQTPHDGSAHSHGLGNEHVAVGQHLNPAWMIQTGRK